MAFQEIKVPDNATIAQKGLAWVDSRFPLTKLFKEHMSEYYAPKKLQLLVFLWCFSNCCFSHSNRNRYFFGNELQA